MSNVVNLRRARKAKARADKDREAESNRARHGTAKAVRDLDKARAEKTARDIDAHRLDNVEK